MPKKFNCCGARFKEFSKAEPLNHGSCRRDRVGGLVSGRKLNVLLGKDPDDTNFMDPDNQHYVCKRIMESAKKILPADPRLKKPPPQESKC